MRVGLDAKKAARCLIRAVGYRRAAQRMMALATEKLKGTTVAGESAVKAMLAEALAELHKK